MNNGNKPKPVDVLLKKLATLPPMIDLLLAAVLAVYSYVAITVDHAQLIGLVCFLVAIAFALLGLLATMREMKLFKIVEKNSSLDRLRGMKNAEFQAYLMAVFGLQGYQTRIVLDEIHRQDDADMIATKRKETLLIQFNHWDEDVMDIRPVQSLHKAAAVLRANSCMAITLGGVSKDAVKWAAMKGVQIVTAKELLEMAGGILGVTPDEVMGNPVKEEEQIEQKHEIEGLSHGQHRFIFIDFVGVSRGYIHLVDLLLQHPAYTIVASTIPEGETIEDLKIRIQGCEERLIGNLPPSSAGRYFAVQHYLESQPEGKSTPWVAVDTDPRAFPEGSTELVAVNPAFGFDNGAAERLRDAILLADRNHVQRQVKQ